MEGGERDAARIGIARFDATGSCLQANDRLCKILGWAREEILGRAWERRVPSEIRNQFRERWRELFAGRCVASVDSYERPDGRRVSVRVESTPDFDAEGRLDSVTCTFVDLVEQRAAEAEGDRIREQVSARREELESIYRNTPVGLVFIDRDLRYVRVNQMIADMNGVDIEEVVGRTYRELSPETADVAELFFRGLMEKGAAVRNLEIRSRPPADPQVEHVYLLNLDPVRDEQGEVVGSVGAVQDVTDLRRAQETAERRLEELEILYASAPVGLGYLDTDLRVVHANDLFAQLGGRPLEEQVGARLEDLIPREIADQILRQLRYVVRTGAPSVDIEVRGRLPSSGGREHTWRAQTHPVMSRDGDVSGIITVLHDVTVLADRRREIEAVRDRLAEAQRVARVGSWEWNILDDEVWWSQEMYEIFGESPAWKPSYVGFFDHVHPADRGKLRQQLDRTLAESTPYRMTFRILRPDGSERTLFGAARLDRTHEGIPARLVGTVQDVTEFDPRDSRSPGAPSR